MAREKWTDLEKIRRQLRKMAFGKPNDCVKLALCADVDIEKLDLSMLTEIKRSEKGTVEIKLLDRTKVLEQLAALAERGDDGAERFLQALAQGMEEGCDDGVFQKTGAGDDVVDAEKPR